MADGSPSEQDAPITAQTTAEKEVEEAPKNTTSNTASEGERKDEPPVDYTISPWRLFLSPYGRINPQQYNRALILWVPLYVLAFIINYMSKTLETQGAEDATLAAVTSFLDLVAVLFLYPTLAVFAKRYHDRNMSGWHSLWALIPIVWVFLVSKLGSAKSYPGRTVYDHNNPLPDHRPAHMFEGDYFLRHWRGFLRLNETFWINGVLLALLLFFLIGLAGEFLGGMLPLGGAFGLELLATLLLILFAVWQLVGLWRASGHALRLTDKRFWPFTTRLMTVIFLVGWGALFYQRGLQNIESLKIVLGDGELGKRSYEIVQNGRELVISGGISYGVVEEVERKLENNPDIKVIRLEGPGGGLAQRGVCARSSSKSK